MVRTKYSSEHPVSRAGWTAVSRWLGYERVHEFNGGLGNQMFQYALALALQARQPARVAVDIRCYGPYAHHNGWEICRVFSMPDRFPEISPVRGRVAYRLAKWLRKVTREVDDLSYKEELLGSPQHGYIRGYWPSYKYSRQVEETLRRNFTFTRRLEGVDALLEQMSHPDAVGVHVRRGDYLAADNAPHFAGICTPAYYDAALRQVHARIPRPRVFLFSDDIDWCKQVFAGRGFIPVEGNLKADAWKDMALFARCSHHVIANSSFSWWGMWLAGRRGAGLRIGPSRLLNPGRFVHDIEDFLEDDVLKIDAAGRLVAGFDYSRPGAHPPPPR